MYYQQALRNIEKAKEDKTTSLTLTIMRLKELPQEIAQLTSLQALYLEHNQLQTLPEEIGRLTSLQTLYLNYNQLTYLPNQKKIKYILKHQKASKTLEDVEERVANPNPQTIPPPPMSAPPV